MLHHGKSSLPELPFNDIQHFYCKKIGECPFQNIPISQHTFFPFAVILNFIPSTSAARLHIIIRCMKISK